jgi:hypothetical protein
MRVNIVNEASVSPFLQKAAYAMGSSLLDFSEEILILTHEDVPDEEADVNVYFTADTFDEDTTTEIAVIVTKEFQFNPAGEIMLDVADKIACTTRALQEEVYNLTGTLAPIIPLNDYEAIDTFLTE